MLAPDVDLGHVDRHDLERGLRIERVLQHGLRDQVGIGQHVGVVLGAADGLDDALADAGDDRLLGGAADQAVELGPHRDAGPGLELNAVLAHAVERGPALGRIGAVDDLGIDAGLDGLEDVAAGQVDGGGDPPGQIHAGLVGGDHGRGHLRDVAAGRGNGLPSPALTTLTPACTRAIFCRTIMP